MQNNAKEQTSITQYIFICICLLLFGYLILRVFTLQSESLAEKANTKFCDVYASTKTYRHIPQQDIHLASKSSRAQFNYEKREITVLDGVIECEK